jgi:hypothetical protein
MMFCMAYGAGLVRQRVLLQAWVQKALQPNFADDYEP